MNETFQRLLLSFLTNMLIYKTSNANVSRQVARSGWKSCWVEVDNAKMLLMICPEYKTSL
jgi:hypothetical protein